MEEQVSVEKLASVCLGRPFLSGALAGADAFEDGPSASVAKKILDDLIEANKEFWPELH